MTEEGVCTWCKEILPMSELHKERDLGLLCDWCCGGIQSHTPEPLVFEEESETDVTT